MAQKCFTAWRLFISYIYFCCADVCARVSPGVYVPHPGLHGLCCHIARVSLQMQPECLYAGRCPPRDVNGISSSTCYFISTLRLRWDNSLGQRGRWEWSRATCFLFFFLAVGFQLGKQVVILKWPANHRLLGNFSASAHPKIHNCILCLIDISLAKRNRITDIYWNLLKLY